MESPRWLSLVLRIVGLIGDGEIGVRAIGDFTVVVVDGTERLKASLGPRRASILMTCEDTCAETFDRVNGW